MKELPKHMEYAVGPELDALIAEKILGWKWYKVTSVAVLLPSNWPVYSWYEPLETPLPKEMKREHIDGSIHFFDSRNEPMNTFPKIPKFSSDHNEMWKVIHHIINQPPTNDEKEYGFGFSLHGPVVRDGKNGSSYIEYYAEFFSEDEDEDDGEIAFIGEGYQEAGFSLPHAVCLAALTMHEHQTKMPSKEIDNVTPLFS